MDLLPVWFFFGGMTVMIISFLVIYHPKHTERLNDGAGGTDQRQEPHLPSNPGLQQLTDGGSKAFSLISPRVFVTGMCENHQCTFQVLSVSVSDVAIAEPGSQISASNFPFRRINIVIAHTPNVPSSPTPERKP